MILSGWIRKIISALRNEGIEEIETNILRIKLSAKTENIATAYEEKVLNRGDNIYESSSMEYLAQFEHAYSEVAELARRSQDVTSSEAMSLISELTSYYNRVRDKLPDSRKRTTLLIKISSTVWTLMPKVNQFPIEEYLNSKDVGKRIAAYKYIEWKPNTRYLDEILVRALGVLGVPFGQSVALIALQRIVTEAPLDESQKTKILINLKWHSQQKYLELGEDRRKKMLLIVAILEHSSKTKDISQ